jgi:hypothetical protein
MSGGIYTHLYKSWIQGYGVEPDLSGMIKDLEKLPKDAKEKAKEVLDK